MWVQEKRDVVHNLCGGAVHYEVKLAVSDGSEPGQSLGHCWGGGGQVALLGRHMALKTHRTVLRDGQRHPDKLEGLGMGY